MSLSSKLKKQQSQSNILSPDTTTRTIRVLEEVKAKMSDPVELHDSQEEESELELPKLPDDVMSILSDKHEDSFEYIVFVSDYVCDKSVKDTLDCYRITVFDNELFQNRDFDFMRTNEIKVIWCCLKDDNCRLWLQRNLKKAKSNGYSVISTFMYKQSKWTENVRALSDIVVKKKDLKGVRYLTIDELVENLRGTTFKISKPIGSIIEKYICGSRVIQGSKNAV
jgi:hypothetical protein